MTTENLKKKLKYFIENKDQIGITLHVLLKHEDILTPKKLDIEETAQNELLSMFLSHIDNVVMDDDVSLINLSSSDERINTLYLYDIEVPDEIQTMNQIITTDDYILFDFAQHQIEKIKAFLIEIGNDENQIVLYKTVAPINIFNRGQFFLKKERHRFTKIEDEFLRINPGFQLMYIDDHYIVFDLRTLEKFFGFHEVIKREAQEGIKAIIDSGLVENTEVLTELVDDVKYARRLTKIAKSSPVIEARIENSTIITFSQNFPTLKNKIRLNSAGDKLQLDTKVSKDLFIKMMMDDFLTSELTKYHYDSKAKDSIK